MIDRLHGKEQGEDGHFPEEWMYSVTRAANAGREERVEGISSLDDGSSRTLKEVLERQPDEMLGASHVKKWGVTPGVLIKIIDSRERLTIQVHPDKEKARELFHSPFGKTECWAPGRIWMRRPVFTWDLRKESPEIYGSPALRNKIMRQCFPSLTESL